MLTAYDASTAEILEAAGVDIILVGDSLAMVVLGYSSTAEVTMDEMIHHAKAVRRGAKKSFIIGDLPLKAIEKGPQQALVSAHRFIHEAGCDAVKLEWSDSALAIAELLVKEGIPTMGHVGLTPQTVTGPDGFRVQGAEVESAVEIYRAALAFEEKKVFSVLLECVPAPLAKKITDDLKVPTIGIGAGKDCDGQVLVYHDVVGLFTKFEPRFVKRYADIHKTARRAVEKYIKDVRGKSFPSKAHAYAMKKEVLASFKKKLGESNGR